jgi:hypothetical protein
VTTTSKSLIRRASSPLAQSRSAALHSTRAAICRSRALAASVKSLR